MKTKKILAAALAGLCAVSAMGISAFAADDTTTKVETAGEKTYKITAGFVAPAIDVTVPTEIKGVINPYKIAAKLDGVAVEAEGVASPRYTITNNSTEVGIKVNATYSADGLDGIVETAAKATTDNTKKQKLAYVTLNAVPGTTATDPAAITKAMSSTEQTVEELLKLDEKATGKTNAGQIWIGGDVIESPADKWTTKDKLTINVVLDINPYNTGAGGSTNTYVGLTALTVKKSGADKITFDADTKTYTVTGCAEDDIFTIAYTATANGTATVTGDDYNATNGKVTIPASAASTVTIKVTDDDDNTKTDTYTINFTA